MDAQAFVRIISSATAALVVILGVFLLTGWYIPSTMPENLRLIMGIVLVLYGGYRITMVWIGTTRKNGEESDE